MDGFEYDWLAEAVKGFERKGMEASNRGTVFRRFDSAMQFVDREGHGVEWAWVRNPNVGAFKGALSPSSHPLRPVDAQLISTQTVILTDSI